MCFVLRSENLSYGLKLSSFHSAFRFKQTRNEQSLKVYATIKLTHSSQVIIIHEETSIMSIRFKTTSPSTISSQSLPNSKLSSDTISISSTASAFSTAPDRYGFYGGTQFSNNKTKETLSKAQILSREKKWLHMLDHW